MRTDDFWAVIDRATASKPASPAEVAERAVTELATLDPEEIVAWGRHLDKVMTASGTEDLWAAANLINGGADGSGFDAFRGWLIAHGRKAVAAAVQSPDVLANVVVIKQAAETGTVFEAEEVLGIAGRAYERATGGPMPAEERPRTRPAEDDLWDFDNEDEMRRRLPKLSALFLEPPDY